MEKAVNLKSRKKVGNIFMKSIEKEENPPQYAIKRLDIKSKEANFASQEPNNWFNEGEMRKLSIAPMHYNPFSEASTECNS